MADGYQFKKIPYISNGLAYRYESHVHRPSERYQQLNIALSHVKNPPTPMQFFIKILWPIVIIIIII